MPSESTKGGGERDTSTGPLSRRVQGIHPREHSNQLFRGHPFFRNLQAFVPVRPVSMWTFHFQPVCDVRVRTWEEMRLYDLLVFTFFFNKSCPFLVKYLGERSWAL